MQKAGRSSTHFEDGHEFGFGFGAFSKKVDKT